MKDSKLKNIGLQFFAEPSDPAPADPAPSDPTPEEPKTDWEAELKKLQAENAKLKFANDNLSKENAEQKRTIRASKTAEEQRAEEEREAKEAIKVELETLRKQSAVGAISKKALAFLGDEKTADAVANALYGAEDADAALDTFQKAWAEREKKLRLEYSKLPAPAAGDGSVSVTKEEIQKMSYLDRLYFQQNYPEAYNNAMKRKEKT